MKTLKHGLFVIAFAGLSVGGATGAYAQAQPPSAPPKINGSVAGVDTAKVVKPFAVKIGGIFPSKGETKDAIGKSTLSLGASYDFAKTNQANPIIFSGYVDYFAPKSKTENILGSSFEGKLDYALGVGASARYVWNLPPGSQFTPYALVGLGFYSIKGKTSGSIPNFVAESRQTTITTFSDDSTKNGLGMKFALGAELKMGIFGELEYNYIPKATPQGANIDISGFGARIGYRF